MGCIWCIDRFTDFVLREVDEYCIRAGRGELRDQDGVGEPRLGNLRLKVARAHVVFPVCPMASIRHVVTCTSKPDRKLKRPPLPRGQRSNGYRHARLWVHPPPRARTFGTPTISLRRPRSVSRWSVSRFLPT